MADGNEQLDDLPGYQPPTLLEYFSFRGGHCAVHLK
jgi:hypothetical protein